VQQLTRFNRRRASRGPSAAAELFVLFYKRCRHRALLYRIAVADQICIRQMQLSDIDLSMLYDDASGRT